MKSLIIYFSRADENYAVGYIDKGNTEIVAEFLRELTGADTFKVEPLVPYSADYSTCIKEAKERIGNAPIKEKPTDIPGYDTVFVMSPIYWGAFKLSTHPWDEPPKRAVAAAEEHGVSLATPRIAFRKEGCI